MRLFLLIYFLCTSFLNAQQFDKEQYDKGVDFVTCVCISKALKKEFDCKRQLKENDIPVNEKATLALFKELQSLKSENKKDVDFLCNGIFNNEIKYKKIYAFADKRKGETLDNIKLKIKDFLVTDGVQEIASDPSEEMNDSLETQEKLKPVPDTNASAETIKEKPMQTSFIEENAYTLIIGVVLVILILYVISMNIRLKKELRNIHERIERRAPIEYSKSDNAKSPGNLNLENKIQELSRKILDLENNRKLQEETSIEKPQHIPIVKNEATNETFYMSVPNEDGTFDVGGKTTKESALYEFIVDAQNQSLAKFTFAARDTKIIQSVVDYSQSYINPVCDPQNALNQNAKKITTIRPGTAEKRNDKWIVLTKAQIKYE